MVKDEVADVVTLLKAKLDFDELENTEDVDLLIDGIYDNAVYDHANSDHIFVYFIDRRKDKTDYLRGDRWNEFTKLGVQIIGRERWDESNKGGLIQLVDQTNRVFERYLNWKKVDPTSNYKHLHVRNEKDLSDKRSSRARAKHDITIELECVGVSRRTT